MSNKTNDEGGRDVYASKELGTGRKSEGKQQREREREIGIHR